MTCKCCGDPDADFYAGHYSACKECYKSNTYLTYKYRQNGKSYREVKRLVKLHKISIAFRDWVETGIFKEPNYGN